MRFKINQHSSDNTYSFDVINQQGDTLLTSDSYPSREACTEAIQSSIASLVDASKFEVEEDGSLILLSQQGTELARSTPLRDTQESSALITQIVREASETSQFDVSLTTTSATARRANRPQAPRALTAAEFAALYNFAMLSKSGETGFELFQSEENGDYYFHFNDTNGEALLYSRGFSTAGQRNKRLESVIKGASSSQRFEVLEEAGRFFFILKARNGQEIARSRSFDTRQDAETGASFVNQNAPTYAEEYIKKRKKRDSQGTDAYLLGVPSTTSEPGFDAFRNKDTRRHYFHLNDTAGAPVLFSQGYTSGKGRDNGIRSVIRNSADPGSYVLREANGTYYFAIIARNRQEIARSRSFASAAERDDMVAFLLTWIRQFAPLYGVTFETDTTETTETFTLAGAPLAAGLTSGGSDSSSDDGDEEDTFIAEPSNEEEVVSIGGDGADRNAVLSGDTSEDTSGDTSQEAGYDKVEHDDEEEEARYATASEGNGGSWLRLHWLIPLLLLLLLLLFLLRGCMGCGGELPPAGLADSGNNSEQVVAESENMDSEESSDNMGVDGSGSTGDNDGSGEGASTATPALDAGETGGDDASTDSGDSPSDSDQGSSRTVLGPDAMVLGFDSESLAGQIANLLSNSERELPQTFVMDKVAFPENSAKLNKSAYPQLENLVKLLNAYPDIEFEFQGHIDRNEDEDSAREFMNGENITLSAVRARCLVRMFEERSAQSDQLSFVGLGATDPITNSTTTENQQKNRRLELIVKKKQ